MHLSRLASLLFVALMVLAPPGRASAHAVPYFASGAAQFVTENDFVGAGHATHLGHYTEVGSVSFAPTGNPDVLAVDGWTIYTAADGDELHALVSGELDTSTGSITVTVTYDGGTGRFADASGTSSLVGQMLGGGAASVAVTGSIDY